MGRKRKHITEEEKRIAKNKTRMRYYRRNKKSEKEKALKRYYENKRNI
jgi:hypothetical protein